MRFLNPVAFFWLAVAIPVILLYFLKLRRRKAVVSSTWLWTRSVQDLRVNAPFQRLRKSLLLFLQLLLIALAVLALTRPTGRAALPEDKRWVLLIDRSASMQMKDAVPSRLAKAKELARDVLKECGPRDEVMVIAFSNRAQVMTPFTASRPAAERAIDLVEPTDAPTRAQEAFRIAASALEGVKHREIVVLSDGRFEPIQGMPEDLPVRFVPVGTKAKNASISALDVRRPARTDEPWTVFAQLDLFHDQPVEIPVELYVNGQLKAVKNVTTPANAGGAVIFEVTKPEPEIVELKLAMDDDFDVDNRAWFTVRREASKILLATPGNFFLEKALAHVKDAESFKTDDLAKASLGEYEVAVLDRIVPDALPEGRYLIFGAVPKWEGITVEGELPQPPVVDWNRKHPAARMVDFSDLSIKSAPKVAVAGYGTPLAEASESPLVFAWERGRTRAAVVTFNVLDSDWPLKLSFPLFISNALAWLRDTGQAQIRPGEPLRIALAEDESEATVVIPSGRRMRVTSEKGRDILFGDTDRCGLYLVERKGGSSHVAVNLLDPQESRGDVATELRLGSGKSARAAALAPPPLPFWRWLAAAALLLLLAEWYVYHRRIEI